MTAPALAPLTAITERQESGGAGFVQHVVVFNRALTLAEFRAYVEARKHFGYDPRGYSGSARVNANTGTWRRYASAD